MHSTHLGFENQRTAAEGRYTSPILAYWSILTPTYYSRQARMCRSLESLSFTFPLRRVHHRSETMSNPSASALCLPSPTASMICTSYGCGLCCCSPANRGAHSIYVSRESRSRPAWVLGRGSASYPPRRPWCWSEYSHGVEYVGDLGHLNI